MFQNYGRTLFTFKRAPPVIGICLRWYASRASVTCCAIPQASLRAVKVLRYAKIPKGYYGGRFMITMLPGSGIGPEMMEYVLRVFEIIKAPIDFEIIPIRPENYKQDLDYAIMSIRRNGACIKAGNIEDINTPFDVPSANVEIRRQLDMYVCVAHCASVPHVKSRHEHINMVVIRQNTEGEYAMLEHENKTGVVESMKIVTRRNCVRLSNWLYRYCIDRRRKRITIVHKSSMMKYTDGLFLNTITKMGDKYPFIEVDNVSIDQFCMDVVQTPQKYDVIVTSNLYGAVITNTVCGLIGGAGLTSSQNYSKNYALFETATRNSAATLAGKNVANPLAILNVSADLLWHLHLEEAAFVVRRAVLRTLRDNVTTVDLGGTHKADEVVDRIIAYLKAEDISWQRLG